MRDGLRLIRGAVLTAALAGVAVASAALAQSPPAGAAPPAGTAAQEARPSDSAAFDLTDLWRAIRHKEQTPDEKAAAADPKARMRAIAPVIGYKPSNGVLLGVAGNTARYFGDPKTTRISSSVASLNYSTKGQTLVNIRFSLFRADDTWAIDGDNRLQWTSQDTFGLGATSSPDEPVNMKFDYFRLYDSAYRRVYRNLYAGVGFHYSAHTHVGPGEGAEAAWDESPYVTYSQTHGFDLESQTSAGASVNLRFDSRDNAINPDRGWLGSVSYRPFFRGFLGGDADWQELYIDARTYTKFGATGRHKLALWVWGDMVTGGVAPYMDLPATGMDKYGRSARGYAEGRFRGERLVYGEIEYRATLTGNGLLGMVAFLNTTTLSNFASGERLFDNFAPGAGAGLRVLLNKRSKTNLCFDIGFGKQGSRGVYLAVEEAF